jgi:hypothetical protein
MRIHVSRTAGAGLAIAVVVAVLGLAGTAQALTKTRSPVPPSDFDATGSCPFTVHVHDLVANETETDTFDAAGNLVRIDIHGHLVTQFTNVSTGQTVKFNASGPITITFNDDGSITAVQRGQSISFDQGVITGHPFLIHHTGRLVTRAVFDPQTGFFDFISQTRTGHTEDICSLLA